MTLVVVGHVTKLNFVIHVITSIRALVVFSIIIRVTLILYSEWHDAHSLVKYTDVDYMVFTDATSFILSPGPLNHAQGPLGKWFNIGDPYRRETYRYTPLLAILLAPNKWLHSSFGKYLFAGCDILAGILMHKLLVSAILPYAHPRLEGCFTPPLRSTSQAHARSPKGHPKAGGSSKNIAPTPISDSVSRRATLLVALHLLNPIVIGISTRGSSESVLSLLVLLTLFCTLQGWWDVAAILLGLSTHWKIYPVIYGVSCVGVIGTENRPAGEKTRPRGMFPGMIQYIDVFVNAKTVRFAVISAGTFLVLGVLMYSIWGYPFLHEAYLYHLHRLDHRHNFSPYFYQIYLTHPSIPTSAIKQLSVWTKFIRSPLTSFLTQLCLSLGSGLFFIHSRQDMVMGWFIQTAIFVIFNKVCTSQYFLWYLLFLPLIIPRLSLSWPSFFKYFVCWMGTQGLWLSQAYKVEFLGEPIFCRLWVCSIIYVVGHTWILAGIADSYRRTPVTY
ncbi:glycosyltransferase family 50 protein [Multifurca ochricompacta]|uniref:GPI mannosyltransferase 1 n=1 Tax=Multifurca ochricompacta TaxID=376703 RepID=A0AAD4MBK8_9AGAM|nr:glycosyltransferase family 50 protein [Multifurca ochricompacta]